MNNIGPVNGADKLKTGKEFVTNLFQSDDDDDDEDGGDDEDEETGGEGTENERDETAGAGAAVDKNSSSSSKEKVQFQEDSQKILLNLSKPTLRNIVMLICDEAVRRNQNFRSLLLNKSKLNDFMLLIRVFYSSKNWSICFNRWRKTNNRWSSLTRSSNRSASKPNTTCDCWHSILSIIDNSKSCSSRKRTTTITITRKVVVVVEARGDQLITTTTTKVGPNEPQLWRL